MPPKEIKKEEDSYSYVTDEEADADEEPRAPAPPRVIGTAAKSRGPSLFPAPLRTPSSSEDRAPRAPGRGRGEDPEPPIVLI